LLTFTSYNDDEPAAKATAPAPVASEPPIADNFEIAEEPSYRTDQNGGNIPIKHDEADDDDDDVDFNLGNGTIQRVETPPYGGVPATAPPTKGPNAKEDG
jgi:hypothetical protein